MMLVHRMPKSAKAAPNTTRAHSDEYKAIIGRSRKSATASHARMDRAQDQKDRTGQFTVYEGRTG